MRKKSLLLFSPKISKEKKSYMADERIVMAAYTPDALYVLYGHSGAKGSVMGLARVTCHGPQRGNDADQ